LFTHFEEVVDDLKRIVQSKFIPSAFQKLIFIKQKRAGINQFHNHIVGNAHKKAINTIKAIAPKKIKSFSIILFD
jgi:hypothetical protein